MGNESGGKPRGTDSSAAVGRRVFLRKAAVAGAGAFAAPMIVTVDSADAQALTSPPPEPPGPSTSGQPGSGGARSPEPAPRRRVSARNELPRTGADIDRLVAAGLAATAGGAALVLWSANTQVRSRATPDAHGPADEEPAT